MLTLANNAYEGRHLKLASLGNVEHFFIFYFFLKIVTIVLSSFSIFKIYKKLIKNVHIYNQRLNGIYSEVGNYYLLKVCNFICIDTWIGDYLNENLILKMDFFVVL